MNKISKAFEQELQGVEAALRRAGLKAKQEAERLSTPYVVYGDSSNIKLLDKNQTNAKVKQV